MTISSRNCFSNPKYVEGKIIRSGNNQLNFAFISERIILFMVNIYENTEEWIPKKE